MILLQVSSSFIPLVCPMLLWVCVNDIHEQMYTCIVGLLTRAVGVYILLMKSLTQTHKKVGQTSGIKNCTELETINVFLKSIVTYFILHNVNRTRYSGTITNMVSGQGFAILSISLLHILFFEGRLGYPQTFLKLKDLINTYTQ